MFQTKSLHRSPAVTDPCQDSVLIAAHEVAELRFIPSAEFETADADERILNTTDEPLGPSTNGKVPTDVPGHLRHLWEVELLSPEQERSCFRRMNYLKFRAARRRQKEDRPEADARFDPQMQKDLQAARDLRDHIVQANLRLVVSLARRYCSDLMSLDDLISAGNLTLLKAVERFDYSRGFRFSTYATHSIRRDFFRAAGRRRKCLEREQPTAVEVLSETLPALEAETAAIDSQWSDAELSRIVDRYLPARERMIVRKRYGLTTDGRVQTLRDIAAELGISKERVRQLQERALHRLRQWITTSDLF